MEGRAVLDVDHLNLMTGNDTALQLEVFELFERQAALWIRLISPDAPVHTWRDAVHSLKGSARGLGLWAVAEACESAEALAKAGVRDNASLNHELARVRRALECGLTAIQSWRACRDGLCLSGAC